MINATKFKDYFGVKLFCLQLNGFKIVEVARKIDRTRNFNCLTLKSSKEVVGNVDYNIM